MDRTTARIGLGLALAAPFLGGCNILSPNRDKAPPAVSLDQKATPTSASLVNYLNQNAARAQSMRASVSINAKAGKQSVALGGLMACQKPKDFRLKASVLGKPAVDIGSNNDEFWYWMSQDPNPYVYHCSYTDMGTGKVNLPFPFQPDMVVAALGIAEYDAAAKYEVKVYDKTVDLIQETKSASGESVKRVTVFNRYQAASGQPQVLRHVLVDGKGKPICRATIHKVTVMERSGAVIPSKVTIEWPAQELSMEMFLSDVQTAPLDRTQSGRLFSRAELTAEPFDIAKGTRDRAPSGMRNAGGAMPIR